MLDLRLRREPRGVGGEEGERMRPFRYSAPVIGGAAAASISSSPSGAEGTGVSAQFDMAGERREEAGSRRGAGAGREGELHAARLGADPHLVRAGVEEEGGLLADLRVRVAGGRTSTQTSGACGKQTPSASSARRAGEAHATSAALTPSEVEIGHSVMTRPSRETERRRCAISDCSAPCRGDGGGVMITRPCRSVSTRPSNLASARSASSSAQRRRLAATCSAWGGSSMCSVAI